MALTSNEVIEASIKIDVYLSKEELEEMLKNVQVGGYSIVQLEIKDGKTKAKVVNR